MHNICAPAFQDISVTSEAAGDTFPGDIRNARVNFTSNDVTIIGCTNLPVNLINADTWVGTANCTWTANISSAESDTFEIGIIVNNYYTRNSDDDSALVTISKPLDSFITGGGYEIMSDSYGQSAVLKQLEWCEDIGADAGWRQPGGPLTHNAPDEHGKSGTCFQWDRRSV